MFFFVCLFLSFCYGPLIGRCFLFVFFLALLLKTSRGTRCGQDRRLSSPTIRNDSSKKKTKDNRPFNDKRGRCTVFGRLDPLHRKKNPALWLVFGGPSAAQSGGRNWKKKTKRQNWSAAFGSLMASRPKYGKTVSASAIRRWFMESLN